MITLLMEQKIKLKNIATKIKTLFLYLNEQKKKV